MHWEHLISIMQRFLLDIVPLFQLMIGTELRQVIFIAFQIVEPQLCQQIVQLLAVNHRRNYTRFFEVPDL